MKEKKQEKKKRLKPLDIVCLNTSSSCLFLSTYDSWSGAICEIIYREYKLNSLKHC